MPVCSVKMDQPCFPGTVVRRGRAGLFGRRMHVITLTCDKCDKLFEIDDDAVGEKVACPYCGDINRVPVAGGPGGRPVATPGTAVAPRPGPAPGPAPAPGALAGAPRALRQPTAAEPERTIAVVRQAMFRAHPFWYMLMVIIFFGGIAMMILAQPNQPWGNAHWLVWAGVFLTGAAVLWWLGWWAAPHRWIKLTITNKRTIRQEGIVKRTTSEVMHRDVRDITIKQGLLQRILNVGYIGIDSAGQSGQMVEDKPGQPERRSQIEIEVENIPKPYKVKEIIDRYR